MLTGEECTGKASVAAKASCSLCSSRGMAGCPPGAGLARFMRSPCKRSSKAAFMVALSLGRSPPASRVHQRQAQRMSSLGKWGRGPEQNPR